MIVTASQICWISARMWLDKHDRRTGRDQVAHEVAHLPDAGRVQAVGRLVEDQQLRRLQQGGSDGEALLHAERVGADALVGTVAQTDDGQHLGDPTTSDAARRGQQFERAAAR